jgi:MFS family permease
MPRTAWVLFAGTFVLRLGSFVFPFLALYLTGEGLSPAEAGLAITGYGIGGVAAQFSGGLLTDRIGRRNAIALSMLTSAALVLLLLEARSLPSVFLVVVLYSFCAELHRPASAALIADIVPSDHRVAAYAFNRLMFNLAWAIGLAVGGFVAERSFTALFVADAATSAIFGVISLVALPHGTRTSKAEEREVGGAFSAILRDRGFLLVLSGIFAGSLIYSQAYSTFPLWVRDLGFDAAVYGVLQAMNGVLVAILELPVTAIALRHTRTRMIALGILLTGVGFGGYAIFLTVLGMAAALVVWTFGEMFASPSAAAFVADRAPSHLRGRYQSSLGITYGLGFTVGPLAGSALFQVAPKGVWVACLGLGVVGCLLAAAGGRRPAPVQPSLEAG